jgi:Flp pilus assembly protein TadG
MSMFKKNSNGVAMVEFAIIAPVFFMLIFGIIDIGITATIKNSIEYAVNIGGRLGRTRGVTADSEGAAAIRSVISTNLFLVDPVNATITITSYPTLEDYNNNTNPQIDNPGGAGEYAFYSISYNYIPVLSILGIDILLNTNTVVRNELI